MTTTAEELAALRATVEAFMGQVREERAESKEHREKIHDRLETLDDRLTAVHAHQQHLLKRMDKVEPITDMVTSLKAKVVGAFTVMGAIGGVIITVWQAFRDEVRLLLGW